MFKFLLLLSLIFPSSNIFNEPSKRGNPTDFVLEINERNNYTLMDVGDLSNQKEIRVYYDENQLIDEIDDDAFSHCANLLTLMLSSSIIQITNAAIPDTVTTLNYTGSEISFANLAISKEINAINYYANDEGFINYWNEVVRPDENISICDMSQTDFNVLYAKYNLLDADERKIVNATKDMAGEKIGDSMITLTNIFRKPQNSQKNTEWKQSSALTFIIIVAIIGMTSISVFFLMKTKKIIE